MSFTPTDLSPGSALPRTVRVERLIGTLSSARADFARGSPLSVRAERPIGTLKSTSADFEVSFGFIDSVERPNVALAPLAFMDARIALRLPPAP